MTAGARQHRDALLNLVADSARSLAVTCEPAAVVSFTAGGAADGNALLTVTWRGTDIQAAYLAGTTYTPGDIAYLHLPPDGTPIAVGRIVGTP